MVDLDFSLFVYVLALVFVMVGIILYDSRNSYKQRADLINLVRAAIVPGKREPGTIAAPTADAAAVAKAASDEATKHTGANEKPAADAVAKAASDAAGKPSTPTDTLMASLDKLIASPEGMEGEGRLAMTLGFVVIIGIVMIQLLMTNAQLTNFIVTTPATSANNATLSAAETANAAQTDLIKTVVTILSGAVTAMVGFYFGAKSAAKPEPSSQS